MKKLFLVLLSIYCVANVNVVVAGIKRSLGDMNRSFLTAINTSLYDNNLVTSVVALFTHNIALKKSSNLIDLKDKQMVACLAGGWLGNALSKLSFIRDLPPLVKIPFKYPFATCWLAYNLVVNRDNIMRDWSNLVVGGYLALNAINDCN